MSGQWEKRKQEGVSEAEVVTGFSEHDEAMAGSSPDSEAEAEARVERG